TFVRAPRHTADDWLDVRHPELPRARDDRLRIVDRVLAARFDQDLRTRRDESRLDLTLQTGKQRERNEQHHDADGEAEHRDQREKCGVPLFARGPEITSSDAALDHRRSITTTI